MYKINKLVVKFKKFKELKKEEINFVMNFITYVLMYGLVVSYVMWGVFGVDISLLTIPAWGMLTYIIKEEIMNEIYKIISLTKIK